MEDVRQDNSSLVISGIFPVAPPTATENHDGFAPETVSVENPPASSSTANDVFGQQVDGFKMGSTPEIYKMHAAQGANKHVSWNIRTSEIENKDGIHNTIPTDNINFEFTLPSPDLVMGASSPDFITKSCRVKNEVSSIDGTPTTTGCLEASLEHLENGDQPAEKSLPFLGINAGSTTAILTKDEINFQPDVFFSGGEIISTPKKVGHDEGTGLYQTARVGNFSYRFEALEVGDYLVDLHLAEIIFTEGPPGIRVFDVFIQEEKVASNVDIYAQVGANHPLVLSDLQAFVRTEEGLTIRFEGVVGRPIVCGIAIRRDCGIGKILQREAFEECLCSKLERDIIQIGVKELNQGGCNCKTVKEVQELKKNYIVLCNEQRETKKALDEVKKENELKSKECNEAWALLKELQNELMRKSMHVGSLAFAVEGQVKEKSKWCSCLQELAEKFLILKSNYLKLSKDAIDCKKCVADFSNMMPIVDLALSEKSDLQKQLEDLKLKYIGGEKERKELYNHVLELKGNIRVYCRCRPLNAEEIAGGTLVPIDFESAKEGELAVKTSGGSRKVFKFDVVFSPEAVQADVFEDTAPLATSVMDGYNVCIFAYGQTGTGKTFTMEGIPDARGVNYRTLEKLFNIIGERKGIFNYEISVSVLEVYNEQIRDLLASASQPGTIAKRLEVRQVAEGVHHVPGLVEANVHNMNEVWEVLQTGTNARAVGSTNANEHSSRSHCIHCVMVKGQNLLNGESTRSKLWLVDLAGSERIAKTEVQGDRLKEAQNINRSLSALGDVIAALSNKNPHIPFRNSKLTHLLQDSLGGDSKTLMFVQISPNENDIGETLCSLNFASRVRGVELGAAKKQVDISEFSKYKQMFEKAKQDIKNKDEQIRKMEEVNSNLEMKVKTKDAGNRTLQDKVKELESQLLVERRLARQHVDTKIAEQQVQEDHPTIKPPLASRQSVGSKQDGQSWKDFINMIRPLTEYNSNKRQVLPPMRGSALKLNSEQKENKPDGSEPPLLRRTARASIATAAQRNPVTPVAPRRNSFIPFPTASTTAAPLASRFNSTFLPPPLPRPFPLLSKDIDAGENIPEMTPWSSKIGSRGARTNNILRRSIQKKVYIKSPLPPQSGRRMGRLETVRYSFGPQGRTTQRVLASNTKGLMKEKQMQKEKERRGWNHGRTKSFV